MKQLEGEKFSDILLGVGIVVGAVVAIALAITAVICGVC